MSSRSKKPRPSLLKELRKSKSGIAGAGILVILVSLTIYAIIGLPANLPQQWNNGAAWLVNPVDAPPTWFTYLGGYNAPTLSVSLGGWTKQSFSTSTFVINEYSSSTQLTWSSHSYPQNVAFIPEFSGNVSSVDVTWTKPSGSKIDIVFSNPQPNEAYLGQNKAFLSSVANFLLVQTGKYYSQLTTPEIVTALFGADGQGILNSSVLPGTYKISVAAVAFPDSNVSFSNSAFNIIGNSYGTMGTDSQGRPIDLGLLAGLPNALEIGFLVAILSVVGGVIFGGISGFLGARKDGVLQWVTLVILAMPALPFLVVMSYSIKLSLVVEVLLIAALSWPFYAIIARTVALSVKSQTFVEADRAMGIPAARSFFSHFMPRLVPVTIAYSVLGIPGGILLAETLAFIGIVPPDLITWGSILNAAFFYQAANFGFWWWVVFPGLMIVVTAVPFVLIGFALERIIAPRVAAK